MHTHRRCVSAACLLLTISLPIIGAATEQEQSPSAAAISEAHRWADEAFARARKPAATAEVPTAPCLLKALHKSNVVCVNQSVWNAPLHLANRDYAHGIYMDAPAVVRVQLNAPATEFSATVGIDNNPSTRGAPDAGSARFHVVIDGQRVFSTPVLTLGGGPLFIRVPLHGARQFAIEVDDGGNGRGWDQCTWADATVLFPDHSTVLLDEGTLLATHHNRSNVPFSFSYDGALSADLLPTWDFTESRQTAAQTVIRRVSYKDRATGLLVECEITSYTAHAGIDWVCWLHNTSDRDTPIIDDFLPLNVPKLLESAQSTDAVTLRWSNGDGCTAESFSAARRDPGAGRQKASASSIVRHQLSSLFQSARTWRRVDHGPWLERQLGRRFRPRCNGSSVGHCRHAEHALHSPPRGTCPVTARVAVALRE